MQFTVDTKTFADQVGWVARLLPTSPPVPVLAGIRVHAEAGRVRLSGFDYEVCGHATVEAEVGEPGTALLPGRLLAEAAIRLPAGRVEVTVDARGAEVVCGSVRYVLLGLPLEDYPTVPEPPQETGRVEAGAFAEAVAQVAPAVCTDLTLVALTGILIRLGVEMELTATDRYRVARRHLDWAPTLEETGDDVRALVPGRTLAQAAKTMAGDSDQLTLGLASENDHPGADLLALSSDTRTLITRLLEADQFPDTGRLFEPPEQADTLTAETGRLLEAVRRAEVCAERATPVLLNLADEVITVQAGSETTGADTLPGTYHGQQRTVALNPRYLADALTALHAETVRLVMPPYPKPVRVTPDSEFPTYRHVVVPIRTEGRVAA